MPSGTALAVPLLAGRLVSAFLALPPFGEGSESVVPAGCMRLRKKLNGPALLPSLPLAAAGSGVTSAAGGGGADRSRTYCWPMLHRLVVTQ